MVVSALPPHWMDDYIDQAVSSGKMTPAQIAEVVANSPEFLDAIQRGLDNKPDPNIIGPSHAQVIREEIRKALEATA